MMLCWDDRSDRFARRHTLDFAACLLKPVKQSELLTRSRPPWMRRRLTRGGIAKPPLRRFARCGSSSPRTARSTRNWRSASWSGTGTRFVANHGREAVSLLTTQPPFDLVLMDVQIPKMDGYEATAAIHQQAE